MDRVILHLDMNSYFASVEQQANYFLRGKAVGVCAYLSPRGCIIASSQEAKKSGIKTGCLAYQALALDPAVVLVQNDPPKYRSVTERIFRILNDYTADFEAYSIDEAFLDITALIRVRMAADLPTRETNARKKNDPPVLKSGNEKTHPHTITGVGVKTDALGRLLKKADQAEDKKFQQPAPDLQAAKLVAEEISQRIKQEVGEWLRCSVGLSRTRFLAKLLSDNGDKDAVTVKDVNEIPGFIKNLKLTDIWGINKRLEKRLNLLNIYTPFDLYRADPQALLRSLHKPGYYLWAGLHGSEAGSARSLAAPKSVGHSYCLPKKTCDKQYLARILMKLAEKTGRRLRELNQDAQRVSVYWSYASGSGDGRSRRLFLPIYDSWDIFRVAWQSLQDLELPDRVSSLAVSVSSFVPPSQQPDLFENVFVGGQLQTTPKLGVGGDGKKRSLLKALDVVNNKYGEFTLVRGAMWKTQDNAPDRIGFRKTVSWDG